MCNQPRVEFHCFQIVEKAKYMENSEILDINVDAWLIFISAIAFFTCGARPSILFLINLPIKFYFAHNLG